MARLCTACQHPERQAINGALIAGEPKRAISARFALSESALKRHMAAHLPATLVRAAAAAEIVEAETLVEEVRELRRRARSYEAQAAAVGDLRTALLGLREQRGILELAARLTGALDAPPPEPVPTLLYAFAAPNWPPAPTEEEIRAQALRALDNGHSGGGRVNGT